MENPLELFHQADKFLEKAEANLLKLKDSKTVEGLTSRLERCLRVKKNVEQEKWSFFEILARYALLFKKRYFQSREPNMRYRLEGYDHGIPVDGDLRGILVRKFEVVKNSEFIGNSSYVHVCDYHTKDQFYDLCESMIEELKIDLVDMSKDIEDFKFIYDKARNLTSHDHPPKIAPQEHSS